MNPNEIARIIRRSHDRAENNEEAGEIIAQIADEFADWFSNDTKWASKFSRSDFYSDCALIAPENYDENAIS